MQLGDYRLNAQARMMLTVTTPARGEGLQCRSTALSHGGLLDNVKALLASGLLGSLEQLLNTPDPRHCEIPAEHIRWLADLGILVPAAQLPSAPVFEPELKAGAASSTALPLTLNPNWIIQDGPGVPPGLELPGLERLSPRRPMLWLRQPLSGFWLPNYLPKSYPKEQLKALLVSLKQGQGPPELQASLQAAGGLLTAEQQAWIGPERPRRMAALRLQLQTQEYLVLRDLLPPLQLAHLRRYLHQLAAEGFYQIGDPMVPMRNVIHNEPLMQFLHQQLAPLIQELLGEPIKPSYAFLASYQPGAELRRHTDRPQCDWNASLLLDSQPEPAEPWPFWLEHAQGTAQIALRPGDLVLYSGLRNPHWRHALPPGRQETVGLFHFVSARFSGQLL